MDSWANWASSSFGPGSGCSVGPISHLWPDVWAPIFKPYQLPPSPCVRIAWARAVIVPVSFSISTCRFRLALIAAISRVLIMTLGFRARLFRFDDLFNLAPPWFLNLLFIWRFCALLSSYSPLSAYAMGSNRSSSLRIYASPPADTNPDQAREVPSRLVVVNPPNAPAAPPPPLGKGKKKINLLKYPKGSDFLKVAVRHAMKVGPSRVGPSYESTFVERYRPPPGVHVWSPDFLTRYVTSVPGMVCFFEVAFDNGLRFPLHPFIKQVLQHFHICPSQLAPNGWGILVGLLVFFRDRGFGVPNVALLLHLFNPTATAEGFIYFPRRPGAPLVISDLPSSHRTWKIRYIFVCGSN